MKKRKSRQAAVILLVILVAVGIVVLLYLTRPAPPGEAEAEVGTLVETRPVEVVETTLRVRTQGTVMPVRSVQLTAQVSGKITDVSPRLEPGNTLREGQTLVQIDPTDYRLAVQQSAAALTQAQAELELERGRQEVAEQEWEYFRRRSDPLSSRGNRELALRQPQLAAALARVQQAEADLEQANINLSRTTIKAPFDATVESETAAEGQLVSPQTPIATLHDRERVWVETAVPVSAMGIVAIPADGDSSHASPAELSWDVGAGTLTYAGRVLDLLPSLSEQGRMARVLIEVDQPGPEGQLPLLLGAYVDVVLYSLERRRLLRVPRAAVHNGEEVYVFDAGELRIVRPDIVWSDREAVFVDGGEVSPLYAGAQLVVSSVAGALEGMPLRRESAAGERQSGHPAQQQQVQNGQSRQQPQNGQPGQLNRKVGFAAGATDGD